MKTLNITQVRSDIYKLVENLEQSHEPVHITGKKGNAVMVSEKDWENIQETLHLMSIPGMAESIREGLEQPIDDCSDKLDW
ncbi:type II toxin-antitoxin system Phd/YefM family antitoxin [Piscirickettsia litoralis]|uniref:Antitoxin n=1 Tax=Piscirickettsia litoralis TaxID=1891921 RepID=A0ABX3A4A3_9GAMM|nr:type II toxin-antitoxin system Phd/YefM family antitoxin [Piscirickettsia litoralis]ODN43350.1 antitoxin [Piscirickettsia litoralis]